MEKAIRLILLWLSCEITAMEGDDERWLFLQEVRDNLRELLHNTDWEESDE